MYPRPAPAPPSTEDKVVVAATVPALGPCGASEAAPFVLDEDAAYSHALLSTRMTASEWHSMCRELAVEAHSHQPSPLCMLISWIPFTICAGPCWVNVPRQTNMLRGIFTLVTKLDKYMFRPRGLALRLAE